MDTSLELKNTCLPLKTISFLRWELKTFSVQKMGVSVPRPLVFSPYPRPSTPKILQEQIHE